jgi:hypothetical protein
MNPLENTPSVGVFWSDLNERIAGIWFEGDRVTPAQPAPVHVALTDDELLYLASRIVEYCAPRGWTYEASREHPERLG